MVLAAIAIGGALGWRALAQDAPRPDAGAPTLPRSEPAKPDPVPPAPPKDAMPTPEVEDTPVAPAMGNVTTRSSEPLKRPRYGAAILQAVDKVTAQTLRFEAKVGQPVRFKGLVITVNACETTAADEEAVDSVAHLNVLSQPEGLTSAPARDAFKGWMFAQSPGAHPFAHPVYDLWLIACKAEAPSQDAPKA